MKKISIIIPFKNTPLKWFKLLIDSLNKQSNKNFEAIFIDDNSYDSEKYKTIINKHGYKYVLNNSKKYQGVGRMRDYGVIIAKYEYIWFVDSDDWISYDAIDYLLKSFYKYPNIDLIVFDYNWVFNYKKDGKINIDRKYSEFVTKNIISKKNMKLFHNNYQTDWRICVKKSFLKENNIHHRVNDSLFEDVYFGLIWKTSFKEAMLTTKKIYYYNRLNVISILNNYKFKPEYLLKTILENKNHLIEKNKFNNIWYFYVLNWIHAVVQLKRKNSYNYTLNQIFKEFFNQKQNLYCSKIIGFSKYLFLYKIVKIKRIFRK